MPSLAKLTILLFFISPVLRAQVTEIDRLIQGELKMTFPSIYFQHNSTAYAKMPYTADSCYKYIAHNFNADVTELVIWRDSAETEELTKDRIRILKAGIMKYKLKGKVSIESMREEQKVSRQTIGLTSDSTKINYLLSLNSVMEFSNTNYPLKKKNRGDHVMYPKITCWKCWKNGFHITERHRRKKKERDKRERNKNYSPDVKQILG